MRSASLRYLLLLRSEFYVLTFRQLSASPYKGGHVIYSGGQTGTIGVHGQIDADPVPNYNKANPVRYAYLTVIDPRTSETLWSARRPWGGLLTGFDSAGARLIKKLEKQTKK